MAIKTSTANRDSFLIVVQAAEQMNIVLEQARNLQANFKAQHPGHPENWVITRQHSASMALTVLQAAAALQALKLPRHGCLDLASMDNQLEVAWVKQTGTLFELIVALPNTLGFPDYNNPSKVKPENWNAEDLKDIIEAEYPIASHDRIKLLIAES